MTLSEDNGDRQVPTSTNHPQTHIVSASDVDLCHCVRLPLGQFPGSCMLNSELPLDSGYARFVLIKSDTKKKKKRNSRGVYDYVIATNEDEDGMTK